MRKHLFSLALFAFVLLGGASRLYAMSVYNESGGLVIMEVENTESPLDLWQEQNSLVNYTGSGYLQFLGNTYLSGPATSPLEYHFKINQSGLYYLHLHAAKTNIVEGMEVRKDVANDCYVRVDGDYNAGPAPHTSPGDNASLALLQADTKYYTYTEQATDQWKWENGFGNGEGSLDPTSGGKRVAVYDFKAGETYTLVVSGRSKYFRLNRIVFRHTSVATATAQNLSTPESAIIPSTAAYTYDAIDDFPVIDAGDVPYYEDNGNDALGIDASEPTNRVGFARAERTFDGVSNTYDVRITTMTEEDGESTYRLLLNGSLIETFENPYVGPGSPLDLQPATHLWKGIEINNGDTIAIESNADTNGEIPEGGGTAWARGRWRQIELTASLIKPPAGRIAVVADGNSPDPDDIGATAVMFGILNGADLQDRLVHLSHSCDLDPFMNPGSQTIGPVDELRRQGKLHELCGEGIGFFGPFDGLTDYFNCRSNQTEAVSNLTIAINASTADDPLWIIEAGEPDVIGYALDDADSNKWQHVHIVSHHPANDDSGDYWTWAQILAFGITEHQIGDQNVGLKTGTNEWDWAYNHSVTGFAWIWDQLRYAEQDGVVAFQTDKFDCSDAGMLYWWMTGANSGGNSNSTPVEMKDMLMYDGVTPSVGVPTFEQVDDGGEWNAGTTWASGAVPTSGFGYTSTLNLNVNDASSTFGGDFLTMKTGGWLRMRDSVNTFVVSNLVMQGGRIYAATGNNVTFSLDGAISIVSDTSFQTYWSASGPRNLNILSTISGGAVITSWASNDASTHTLTIDNAANDFSGTWVSQNGTLLFNNAGAVGTADIAVLDHGKLEISGDWNAYATLTVADTATASVELGSNAWQVSSLMIGSSNVPAGVAYTAAELNAMGTNPVFTGSGTISIGPAPPVPQSELVAGWDTWSSAVAPGASVVASNVTASALTTTEDNSWNTTDTRGASNDGTWGDHVGPPAASTAVVSGENLTLPNATPGGTITCTISNNGATDIVLNAFHFDAYAFRPKAPRAYELSVLAGSGISTGVVFTSADDAITHVGGAHANDAHDQFDLSLTGLADHTLAAGESVDFLLAFSSGVGDDAGGHHLFVDNMAVSLVVPPAVPPVVDAGSGRVIILPSSSVDLAGTAVDDVSVLYALWTQESGPNTAILTDKRTLAPNVSGLVEGTYVFRLTATDEEYNSAYDEVTVLVALELTPEVVQAMYDQWAVDQGLTPAESNPSLDLDGDGATNMEEFLSDHDPLSPASVFAVESIQTLDIASGQIVIEWEAKPDRTYSVLQASEPDGIYNTVADDIVYPQNSHTVDVSQAESGFLKIDVRLP